MALPTLNVVTHTLTLPSTGDKLKYRPFLVKEQKAMMMAQETEDDTSIQDAIAQCIQACTFEKIDPWILPAFDMEYIFLKIRGKSIGEKIELTVLAPDDDETEVPITVDLTKVECTMTEDHTNEIELTDTVKLIMKYPTLKQTAILEDTSESVRMFDMIKSCVYQIVDGETIHQDIDIPSEELEVFIENMSSLHLEKVTDFFETMPKLTYLAKVTNPKTKKKGEVLIEGFASFFE